MAKKLKVGIIGLGWPGREHLKGYKPVSYTHLTLPTKS